MDEVEPRVAGSTTLRNQAAFTELGLALRRHRDEFAAQMHAEMLAGIDGLPHDEQMRDLLMSSVLANIETRGLPLMEFVGRVIQGVESETQRSYHKRQTPYIYGSFSGRFCFAGCPGETDVPPMY